MGQAFEKAGYDGALGKVTVSNRPDLCEYQCNGAMAGAKQYHKAPFMIAEEVAAQLKDSAVFSSAEAVKPGFLNLKVSEDFIRQYVGEMADDPRFGSPLPEKPKTVVLDYGGPNIAKPLHVGHLRSAVIGEAIKRIVKWHGDRAIGDIHLGDWGLQMGLVITELKKRQPEMKQNCLMRRKQLRMKSLRLLWLRRLQMFRYMSRKLFLQKNRYMRPLKMFPKNNTKKKRQSLNLYLTNMN